MISNKNHFIVGPLIKGGVGTSENCVTWMGGGEVRNFLLERGDKPVKEGGVDVEIGGCHFLFFTVQSYLLCVGGK